MIREYDFAKMEEMNNAEFERLHNLINHQAGDIRNLIVERNGLVAEKTELEGQIITLKNQMALDFVELSRLRLQLKKE